MEEQVKLMLGNNLESLRQLEDNSVDSVVTDPPYGLSFMNKKWDHNVPSVEFWQEVYRVLKPGGHVLSFGGTRTYHRMVVNIEDAGFEIRDQIMWLYGSGFPKSLNIGKAVDKLQGNERLNTTDNDSWDCNTLKKELNITKGQSPYEGWGTALKPANEPICVARKPISEKTVAENVLKWRTGGINVDGCRIETTDNLNGGMYSQGNHSWSNESHNWGHKRVPNGFIQPEGRFPANIILECLCDEVIKGEKGEFPGGSTFGGGEMDNKVEGTWFNDKGDIHTNPMCPCYMLDEQSGGASRFFYQAKVSKAERNMGLDEFESKSGGSMMVNTGDKMKLGGASLKGEYKEIQKVKNTHPTVKPINLMTYLCRLITPPNGIVLDPFMGSGSTGISARLEGFKFMGMEMDEDYFKIAETRINNYEEYRKFLNK